MISRSDEAAGYVMSHVARVGAYGGDTAPHAFLGEVADEIANAKYSELFPQRYKEHVAYAVGMVARHGFLEPPAAIAAVYLATRFEYFFRVLSGKLEPDGKWKNAARDQGTAIAALGSRGLQKGRVSDVAITYKLVKLNNARPIARIFDALDKSLFPVPTLAVGGFPIADIGDRIAFGRNSAGHGHWGDISSEAVFYGLVTAIVFYNQL